MDEVGLTAIAGADEVLETVTGIMRREDVKITERLKAAEWLGKALGLWSGSRQDFTELPEFVGADELEG